MRRGKHPENALIFRGFEEQLILLDQMGHLWLEYAEEMPPEEALFAAYEETHPEAALFTDYCEERALMQSVSIDADANEFHKLVWRMMNHARNVVTNPVREHFDHLKEALVHHNWVRDCVEPCELLETAIQNAHFVDDISDPWADSENDVSDMEDPIEASFEAQRIIDARRVMAITFQLIAIEFGDARDRVKLSLRDIDELSRQRLFARGGRKIFIVSEVDSSDDNRVVGYRDDAARVWTYRDCYHAQMRIARLRKLDRQVKFEKLHWKCRVVDVGDEKFVVYVIDRGKDLDSALRKLETKTRKSRALAREIKRKFSDLRGIKYVLVRVEQTDGKVRTATRRDVEFFMNIIRERLWHTEFIEEQDNRADQQYRNRNYWDRKFVGRFLRHGIDASVELIVTSIGDYLSTKYSTGEDNHKIRRRKQIKENLCPIWWPEIDWTDPEL